MKIRSITSFYDPALSPDQQSTLDHLAHFSGRAASLVKQAGFEVQSQRLALAPFPGWIPSLQAEAVIEKAVWFENQANKRDFQYISIGPALPHQPASYQVIPSVLSATRSVFATGLMTRNFEVVIPAVIACGEIITQASTITPDGFTNLRFSALANVPSGAPFLPAAYHEPETPPAFAIAVECADVAIEAFSTAKSLEEARFTLLERLEKIAHAIQTVILALAEQTGIRFLGFDFSLAPYPADWCSLAGAIENVGVAKIGNLGSLGAAAFVADTLDRGNWPRAGFNGLMLPVLEDSVLAQRTIDGVLEIKDLLLYSAVCGTGLDTVPVPGNCTAGQISALLMDVAALAVRLNKPLTARLMPVPGKKAGEMTQYEFEFFANGRVMPVPALPLTGMLASNETLQIQPRKMSGKKP